MTTVPLQRWPDRVNILGVGVSAIDIPRALQTFGGWIAGGARHYVCVADVHAVMQARWNPDYRAVQNGAGMVTPDGMPLVWLARRARGRGVRRVYGPDLLHAACAFGLERGWRHAFYGGAPGVAPHLAERLRARFPGLEVAGVFSPPFRPLTEAETAQDVAALNASGADIVWIGLGAPKQEYWMHAMRPRLAAPVLIGVGAAFDFHSGAKRQAPAMLRALGLEWLFRLASEPARLWPRYRRVIPGFVVGVFRQATGLERFSLDQEAA